MTERPSAFNRSVEQIAHEVQAVARSWSEESRLVRDEAMGAELLLSREIVEQFGILFESADRLNDLFLRQAGHLFRDFAATARHAAAEPGLHNCRDVAIDHWQRRIAHIAEGSSELTALLRSEGAKFGEALFGLWRPFAAVLDRDWQDSRRPARSP